MSRNRSKARRQERQFDALDRRKLDRNWWRQGHHPAVETRNPDEKVKIAEQDIANLTTKLGIV